MTYQVEFSLWSPLSPELSPELKFFVPVCLFFPKTRMAAIFYKKYQQYMPKHRLVLGVLDATCYHSYDHILMIKTNGSKNVKNKKIVAGNITHGQAAL